MISKYKEKKKPGPFKSIVQWLWRLFSSVRLAVILILIITALSLLGALLVQVPSEIASDPQAYYNWIDTVARSKVGVWTPFLSALRLFNVFSSPWFIIVSALLMLNIFICSLNRWRSINLSIRGSAVKQSENFYTTGNTQAELKDIQVPVADAAMISEKVLKGRGYRTRTESDKNNSYITADKNRYYRLGTYFSHFSLILFVLAFVAGNYFGFRDVGFSVPVGSIREVGHETALSLKLISFVDEYYDNGKPKDYRSEVVLYENSQPVKQAIIQVNHPMIYKGVRFYQSYFGPAKKMQVRDINGIEIFNDNVPMDSSFVVDGVRRYEGFFDLLEAGLSIRLISSAVNTEDFIIPAGHVAVDVRQGSDQIDFRLVKLSTPIIVGGLEFTFVEESQYSGFQVSQDPASIIIWIASALFIIGICAVLYFPYRQVWVLSQPLGQRKSRLLIRTRSPRGFRSTSELNTLVDQIQKQIQKNPLKGKEDRNV
ncbi:MAG: cytochrome c biogenesis protein ResB [Actinobacteria bacterium]|nr:cytochrome c biogenesis protein ResB [Actinomycetota bacterium]